MTWSGGYAEAHLFRTSKECCDKWFPDSEKCYVDGGYTGYTVQGGEEVATTEEGEDGSNGEEIAVENYHQRPVITSTEEEEDASNTEATAGNTRPTRPVIQATQQTKPTQPKQQDQATFPTSSCGTTLFTARECNRLSSFFSGSSNTLLPTLNSITSIPPIHITLFRIGKPLITTLLRCTK